MSDYCILSRFCSAVHDAVVQYAWCDRMLCWYIFLRTPLLAPHVVCLRWPVFFWPLLRHSWWATSRSDFLLRVTARQAGWLSFFNDVPFRKTLSAFCVGKGVSSVVLDFSFVCSWCQDVWSWCQNICHSLKPRCSNCRVFVCTPHVLFTAYSAALIPHGRSSSRSLF